ncbi:MAG: GIY-YIG nuclease family protein [Alphaproteobacteria bacterium]
MTGKETRKALTRAYKEVKPEAGIYAVRCAATGAVFVGPSRNIARQQTSLWFSLRSGSFPNPALQNLWRAEGEAAFAFEPLEVFPPEELTPYLLEAKLKERLKHWRAALAAATVSG